MAAAAFYPEDRDDPGIICLRDGSSVFNAELECILLALKKFLALSKSIKKLLSILTAFLVSRIYKEKPSEPKLSSVSTTS